MNRHTGQYREGVQELPSTGVTSPGDLAWAAREKGGLASQELRPTDYWRRGYTWSNDIRDWRNRERSPYDCISPLSVGLVLRIGRREGGGVGGGGLGCEVFLKSKLVLGQYPVYALLPGGFDAEGSQRRRRDAWKQLVGPNSFESPGGGLNWLSPPCVGPLCSVGGGGMLSITCISYLGFVNTSKPWKSYRDNPHVLEGQMGNPGHPEHRSGLSLRPGWARGREG